MTTRTLFITLGLAIGGALLLVLLVVATAIGDYTALTTDVEDTKAWCEQLAADLEGWRAVHGEYPDSLAHAGLVKSPPSLGVPRYWPSEDGFRLSFSDSLYIERVYDSKERRWSR